MSPLKSESRFRVNEIKATDFASVYEDLGIDTGRLGCIMIDTKSVKVDDVIPEEALYFSEDQDYVQGIVSQTVPHITLLYGLLRSGLELRRHVSAVLTGWSLPELEIEKVSFFYGKDDSYITVIALIKATPELLEGNARLRLLPHIDTFGEYHPHLTLAYVKADSDWQGYVDTLDKKYAGQPLESIALNFGK